MHDARAYVSAEFVEVDRNETMASGTVNGYAFQVWFSSDGCCIRSAPLREIQILDTDGNILSHWRESWHVVRSSDRDVETAFDVVVDRFSEAPSDVPAETVLGYPVEYERRRYGRQSYCWAYIYVPGIPRRVSLGDPYPAARWRRSVLEDAVRDALEYIGI